MTLTLRLAFLLPIVPVLSLAASWSGALVDGRCFASAQQNVSHGHPGSTDTKRAIRSCSPTKKTESFSIVEQVGTTFNLDSDGNHKAHALVVKEGKKSPFRVTVTGDMDQETLKVETISMAR